MPKLPPTKSKVQTSQVEQQFDMTTMFKSVEDMITKLTNLCLKNVPQELPEDKNEVNKMFELVRDGYVELSRLRELVGTSLNSFSDVLRRLADSRSKANACAEIELEPSQQDNLLNEDSFDSLF